MKAEEKAKEIIELFLPLTTTLKKSGHPLGEYVWDDTKQLERAKQCALICVDEIIKSNPFNPNVMGDRDEIVQDQINYWQQVKQEIEKL